jgi:hypothetical protein
MPTSQYNFRVSSRNIILGGGGKLTDYMAVRPWQGCARVLEGMCPQPHREGSPKFKV